MSDPPKLVRDRVPAAIRRNGGEVSTSAATSGRVPSSSTPSY